MSRTQSPQVASTKAERLRRQQRKEKLILVGVVLLMITGMVTYCFYLKYFYFNKPRSLQKPAAGGSTPR